MSIKFNYNSAYPKNETFFTEAFLKEKEELFLSTINDEAYGFFNVIQRDDLIQSSKVVFEKFKSRKHFVQVGIGGSSLGPEMLVTALQKDHSKVISFINNIDPEMLSDQLAKIDLDDALFYFVSKSGGTAETMASFAIIINLLLKKGIKEEELKNYFVFATDPKKSQLLEIGQELGIDLLEVPSNVGGRFSVLTPVGYLPALFAGLDLDALVKGARDQAHKILNKDLTRNELYQSASFIYSLKENSINQTVLMPYSSKLRDLSFWYVQLWAESLGKERSKNSEIIEEGLTPIPAYGATDQHSQMQLFMEGPRDKLLILIEVEEFSKDFSLSSEFKKLGLMKLKNHSMAKLMKAELQGTLKALSEKERPYIHMSINKNDESSLGALIIFFESLTALMGHYLNVDPFDQPGVELGKVYAYEWLEK